MEEGNAIEISHVSKSFKVYLDKGHEIKDYVTSNRRRRYESRNVLKDISFSVKKGEAVGLIGHNGCGKSTTLKLLTRIMYPDSGTVMMKGRVSSLIELGAGFHPDMSGRENIYINASILGLGRKEIDRRMDSIIAFSELGDYIDNPVRTYSSGMYMRLAFSVAINVDADILLVDEILAVGDVNFQAKCFNRLREIKSQGTTIVLVSHSASQIEQICDRSIWIQDGTIFMEGSPTSVNEAYLAYMNNSASPEKVAPERQDDKKTRILRVSIRGREDTGKKKFKCGEPAQLKIEYQADLNELDNPLIGLKFIRNDGLICYGTNTEREHIWKIPFKEKGALYCNIERLNLTPGEYWIDVAIRNGDMRSLDYAEKCCQFQMYSTVEEIGVARLDHSWEFEE